MAKKLFFIIVVSLLWVAQSYSNPYITNVRGNITKGGTVTINGSDFLDKTNAAPLKWDDFESGSNGSAISGWSSIYGNPGPVYSNENQRTGSILNYKAEMNAGDTQNYNSRLYYTYSGNLTKVFVSFWIRYDSVDSVEQQVKTWRLTDTYPYSEDASAAEFTWGENNARSYMAGASDCGKISESNDGTYTKNVWTLVEVEAQESTAATEDGILRVWKSQTSGAISQGLNSSTFKSRCGSDNHWLSVIFGQYAQLLSGQSVTLYYDDIYIDNTWSRVVIGDNANYNSCTKREIQIPINWSNSMIEITFNPGSFGLGNAWLYVIDKNGDISGCAGREGVGYPIVIK